MKKRMTFLLVVSTVVFSIGEAAASGLSRAEKLRRLFLSGDTNYVFVVSHRMDWRNHPENSLSAAKSAIAMGVDILELDPAITLDERFALLHDARLERTTDGSGWAWDYTLEEIRSRRLRKGLGGKNAPLTDECVASLDEVLVAAKGRCLVNIDKFAGQSAELLSTIKRLGMERQVICKSGFPPEMMKLWTGAAWKAIDSGEVVYMPIVNVTNDTDGVEKLIGAWRREKRRPCVYEVCMKKADGVRFFEEFHALPERPRLWLNVMWAHLTNGHAGENRRPKGGEDSERDAVKKFREGWAWALSQGATALQTDNPAELVAYLEKIGRHTLPETVDEIGNAQKGIVKKPRRYWEGKRLYQVHEPGEVWWGAGTAFGRLMPFGCDRTSSFFRDLSRGHFTNQTAPLLVSSHGRWIWCEDPLTVWDNSGRWDLVAHGENPILTGKAGSTLREAFKYCAARFFPPSGKMPDEMLFSAPQYNTWIELNYHQNQKDILAYAQAIRSNSFPPGVIMIDDTWQTDYGVWEFDASSFDDPKAMCDELHRMGFKISLWVCPFISPDSRPYRALRLRKEGGLILKRRPYTVWIQHWWNGESAVLDLTNPAGRGWFEGELKRLVDMYGVDGFKFDAGDAEFYSPEALSYGGLCNPVRQAEAYADIAAAFPLNELRACWKRGGQPLAQRLNDKACGWDDLNALIPDMIAAGLIGHPFVCPDMIGGGLLRTFKPGKQVDQEFFVRSSQIHALSPMMQFSAAPWRILDKEHFACVKAAVELRQRFVPYILSVARECAESGEPMLRNLEYVFPGCGYENIKDEFMLGDDLLVAPVQVKGARSRKVVVPSGEWRVNGGDVVKGPGVIDVDAPLAVLPYLVRNTETKKSRY